MVDLNLTYPMVDGRANLRLNGNPLSNESIRIHIPAMQKRGIYVSYDHITHPELKQISGDNQEGVVGKTLTSPLIVEYRDANDRLRQNVDVAFSIREGEGELTDKTATTNAEGKAQTFLQLGWKLGSVTVRATAEGVTIPIIFTAKAVLPDNHVPEDVNVDGVVDVMDLVLVAATIGTTPPEDTYPNPDVNGDGVINSEDLALVMAALENAPTAPAAAMTAENLQRWIDEAKQLANKDETFLRGIEVLEQLLETLLPKKTALLANYPNPFNPETWIPFHLAKPAEVTLHIYGVDGALVRTLTLGHRHAGIYEHRTRAAYWDGRNTQGERVASGIYLYTLTAGDYTSTRKMLIRK
ncbi:T9SS type A sorting domain-containing protein [Candidatus Poribacteria bacterium]|nr:T9SS type A sorting domain-containing protein [Candidatus Poribacteria bacterium]